MKWFISLSLLILIFSVKLNAQSYNATWIGSINTPTKAFDVKVVGRFAYIVGWYEYLGEYYGSFSIIDVQFPSSPNMLSSTYINDAYGIEVKENYAYIAESNDLLIYDISNPSIPDLVGEKNLPASAKDVKVINNLAYVADESAGLRIVDISNPSNPIEIGSFNSPGSSFDVEIKGDIAYLADYSGGFLCLDISNPSNPVLIGQYPAGDAVIDIDIKDTLAFCTDGYNGMKVLNISDPENLRLISSLSIPYWCLGIKVSDDYVYIAAWQYGGLRIIDISDPSNLQEVGYYNTEGYSRNIDVSGSLAYIADWDGGGLQIINNDLLNPIRIEIEKHKEPLFELKQNYPNPFNPITLINYQLPCKSYMTLKVYDILGHNVATIKNEEEEAGYHQVSFNGSDLASGIYLYALQTDKNIITKKMILLK